MSSLRLVGGKRKKGDCFLFNNRLHEVHHEIDQKYSLSLCDCCMIGSTWPKTLRSIYKPACYVHGETRLKAQVMGGVFSLKNIVHTFKDWAKL